MCRLLGVVKERSDNFLHCLRDAPRSLVSLSREHPDGWGIGVWTLSLGWRVQKRACTAMSDVDFNRAAQHARGQTLIAHIRKRTVGDVCVENTHPFVDGSWTFAHNGTIGNLDALRERTSPTRRRNVRGQTDSELLFARVLSQLDSAKERDRNVLDRVLMDSVASLDEADSATFLMSDGLIMYAFRRGQPLFSLVRDDPSRCAVLFASERLTDEPWQALDDGALVRVTRTPKLGVRLLTNVNV